MEAIQKIRRSWASEFNFIVESEHLELIKFSPEEIGKISFAFENGKVIEGNADLTLFPLNAIYSKRLVSAIWPDRNAKGNSKSA